MNTPAETHHPIATVPHLLRALIVDDEPLGRRRIRDLVAPGDEVDVVGECRSAAEAIRLLPAVRPDVLFLDVGMPCGSGFSVVESLDRSSCPAVIFVSAHASYAADAFAARAVDYLVKPFTRARFEQSLERAREFLLSRAVRLACGAILWQPRPEGRTERFAVKGHSGITYVRADDVAWIEAEGNYVRLHTGRDSHLFRETMQHMERRLDPSRFARTHRSTIVNVERIVQLLPSFGRNYVIVLNDGRRLKLGAPYRENLRRLGFDF